MTYLRDANGAHLIDAMRDASAGECCLDFLHETKLPMFSVGMYKKYAVSYAPITLDRS
jgi:hypothetical protein